MLTRKLLEQGGGLSRCLRISIVVKTHCDHSNSCKGKHWLGLAYRFRGAVHCHNGGENGGMRARMVLEK